MTLGRMGLGLGLGLGSGGSGVTNSYVANNFVSFAAAGTWLDAVDGSGITDNGTILGSFWAKVPDSTPASTQYIYDGTGTRNVIQFASDGTFIFFYRNSAGGTIGNIRTDAAVFTNDVSTHVAWSFDLSDSGKAFVYVNGVSVAFTISTYLNQAIDWSLAEYAVGAQIAGTSQYLGSFQEFYLTNEYLDLSANISKLRSGGKPADLGANGSSVTGTQPLIYLKNAFGSYETNLGSLGNFTVNGTPADEGTSPSD